MNLKSLITCLSLFICSCIGLFGQITIEGYTFESGNRGFLSQVVVTAEDAKTGDFIQQVTSDNDGKFIIDVAPGISSVKLKGFKDLFHEIEMTIGPKDITAGKAYVKMQLKRSPGYIFEITLAEKSDSIGSPTNHIRNALIEVYNNTTKKPILVLDDHPHPDFKVDLSKGNHYTVMIRKKGFLTKRMEAFVDVAGCILCFEGIGDVRPGVSDNLSEENTMGTLLANVELEPLFEGKRIELQNIYYDLGKSEIRPDAAAELDKAAIFLNDNPQITVELGSHTDSRGKSQSNMDLSVKRAQSAVDYLVKNGDVEAFRINARGYGEGSPAVKCGSNCTEDEYARNRRSEIKILGVAPGIAYKSLEKIKYDENFDEMILALQEEGQVKVPEDGELPPGIKDADENENIVTESSTESEKVIVNKKAAIEESVVVEEKVVGKVVEAIEAEKAVSDKLEEKIVEKAMIEQMSAEVADTDPEAVVSIDADVNTTSVSKILDENNTEVTTIAEKKPIEKVVVEKNVPTEIVNKEIEQKVMVEKEIVKKDSSDSSNMSSYTGHKIVVAFRRNALPSDDELFSVFPDLSAYQAKAGYYLYLTGDFETKADAEARIVELRADNPNVYIVEFDNGNRVN